MPEWLTRTVGVYLLFCIVTVTILSFVVTPLGMDDISREIESIGEIMESREVNYDNETEVIGSSHPPCPGGSWGPASTYERKYPVEVSNKREAKKLTNYHLAGNIEEDRIPTNQSPREYYRRRMDQSGASEFEVIDRKPKWIFYGGDKVNIKREYDPWRYYLVDTSNTISEKGVVLAYDDETTVITYWDVAVC